MRHSIFNPIDFVNDTFSMKALLGIGDVYVQGLITREKDKDLEIALYNFDEDKYTKIAPRLFRHIRFYIVLE